MYNALNQAKQAEAVKREFQAAFENGQFGLAGRIVEANPDLTFNVAPGVDFVYVEEVREIRRRSPQTIHEALGGR